MKTETAKQTSKWNPMRRTGSGPDAISQQYLKAGLLGIARWGSAVSGNFESDQWYVVFARDAYPYSPRGYRTAAEARAVAEKHAALATAK